MSNKKSIILKGRDPELEKRLSNIDSEQRFQISGIAGGPLKEPLPQFLKTTSEEVISNGNSWIVLGRDRPRSRISGYGGRGNTQCSSIDIVVGRMSSRPLAFNASGDRVFVDPDVKTDASRIYLSQKTDVDKNFKLARGQVGNAIGKSAVALKADGIRLISREGIKLVTRADTKNSQGGNVESITGIDLIAGNNDKDLQPIVKGFNANEAFKRLVHHVDKLSGVVDSLLMAQMVLNQAVTHHFHYSPFFGLPTTPSPPVVAAGVKTMMDHLAQTKRSLVTFKVNLQMYKQNYFNPAGGKYICSRYNNVN